MWVEICSGTQPQKGKTKLAFCEASGWWGGGEFFWGGGGGEVDIWGTGFQKLTLLCLGNGFSFRNLDLGN